MNSTLRQKFGFGLIAVLCVCLIFLLGVRLLGKGALFHYLEREHMDTVLRLDAGLKAVAYGTPDAALVTRKSVLDKIERAHSIAQRADTEVFAIEEAAFRLVGYGAVFDLPRKDIVDLNRMEAAIRAELGDDVTPALVQKLAADMATVVENSNAFAPLMLSAVGFIKTAVILLTGFGIAILLATFVLLRRSTLPPLEKALEVANRIAQGDLTGRIEVEQQDEIGQLLQALAHMNENLLRLIEPVKECAQIITSASQDLSDGTNSLMQRTEQQASSLEETSSTMEELTAAVRQNAEHALVASQTASETNAAAVTGGRAVAEMTGTMAAIQGAAQRIVDIITVIDNIAFQTNLLALNAAVESAHAGAQGHGFAVVAAEVRALAQRAATAATEVKALIDESVGKIASGVQLATNVSGTIEQVVQAVQQATQTINDISAATAEQSAGIEQINQAITEMDQVTQRNAALAEQTTSTAATLSAQARRLIEALGRFKLGAELAPPVPGPALSGAAARLAAPSGPPAALYSNPRRTGTR